MSEVQKGTREHNSGRQSWSRSTSSEGNSQRARGRYCPTYDLACQQQPTESPTCDKDNTATHGAQLEDKTQNWRTWAGSTIVRRNLRH